jgi:hypothetical protein
VTCFSTGRFRPLRLIFFFLAALQLAQIQFQQDDAQSEHLILIAEESQRLGEKFLHALRQALLEQLGTIQTQQEKVKPSGVRQRLQAAF